MKTQWQQGQQSDIFKAESVENDYHIGDKPLKNTPLNLQQFCYNWEQSQITHKFSVCN